jgi:hypothetical protein
MIIINGFEFWSKECYLDSVCSVPMFFSLVIIVAVCFIILALIRMYFDKGDKNEK